MEIGSEIAMRVKAAGDARAAVAERFFQMATPAEDADVAQWRSELEHLLLNAREVQAEWIAALAIARDLQQALATSAAVLETMGPDDGPRIDPKLN